MKIKSISRAFMLIAAIFSMAFINVSCDKEEDGPSGNGGGTISGIVKDSQGNLVEGVEVKAKGVEGSATTDVKGEYTLTNVPMAMTVVTFSKTGYQTANVTVPVSRFDANGNAKVNATLTVANAKLTGKVLDGVNNSQPFAGVTVKLNDAEETTVTTNDEGVFLFENLTVTSYNVTVSYDGYIPTTVAVAEGDFNNDSNTAVIDDVTLTKTQLLPGLTLNDLQKADKWYYNEYRGGSNGEQYPRWDWSTCFMGSLNFVGNWQEHGEGTCLELAADANKPANPNAFESYIWGSKLITEDNKMMTVRARTFGDRDGETVFGVVAIDLSASEPNAVVVGEKQRSASPDYRDYYFDFSDFVGKEVVIGLGLYRDVQDDKEKHLAIRRINFTKEEMHDWAWISGTDVAGLEGWHMTQEIVRSTMVNDYKEFSGLTTGGDNRKEQYQSWRTNNHIGWLWNFTVISKDTEIFASQGSVIKTNGGSAAQVNTKVPESYFYSKFAISGDNDEFTFKLRNFGSNFTFAKLTVITEDMEVKHILPKTNTAVEYGEAEDGCFKYKNDKGEPTEEGVKDYADFTFDLSEFNGKNVIVAFGVYKGEDNGDENKICFHSVTLQ